MERKNTAFPSNASQSQRSAESRKPTLLTLWYHYVAPPDPPASASLAQREKARHGKVASLTIPVFMLFLFALFLQAMINHSSFLQEIMPLAGLEICSFTLLLNRRGFVTIAGVTILTLQYLGAVITLLNYPVGLTTASLPVLDLAIVPSMLVLAFFPAKYLFPIAALNIVMDWCIVMYGPHDAVIAGILHDHPFQLFFYAYLLQFITTIVLYLWGRSTELAIARADQAEAIAVFERREKESKEQELEQKRQLDYGIQQILQTHIAVANGNLNARAPLHPNHKLWQVASALNNLISRLQKVITEREPEQTLASGEARITGGHPAFNWERQLKHETSKGPVSKRPTADEKYITGSQPAYVCERQTKHQTGKVPIPKRPMGDEKYITGSQPASTWERQLKHETSNIPVPKKPTAGEEKYITGNQPASTWERQIKHEASSKLPTPKRPIASEEKYSTGSHPAYTWERQIKHETGNVPIPKRPMYRN